MLKPLEELKAELEAVKDTSFGHVPVTPPLAHPETESILNPDKVKESQDTRRPRVAYWESAKNASVCVVHRYRPLGNDIVCVNCGDVRES